MNSETKHAFLTAIERTHGRHLRRYLATRLRAVADVGDLSQEVYLRLLRIEDHEKIRNPQAYLITVASHVLHQHALRTAAIPDTVEISDVLSELESEIDRDPAYHLDQQQRIEDLGRALETLSPRAYATLILHRCDGVSLVEIATRFGVSYTMVKRYLSKALAFCQQQLNSTE